MKSGLLRARPLLSGLVVLAVLSVGFPPPPAAAGLIIRQKKIAERPHYKLPFSPQWVTRLKKGAFIKYKRKEWASPRAHGDRIYVGADSGYFYALRKKRGGVDWRVRTEGAVNSAPAFDSGLVFIGDNKAILYAFNESDGKEVWRKTLDSEILTAPAVNNGVLYVATQEGRLTALSSADGTVIWSLQRELNPRELTIRGTAAPVYEAGPHGGRVYLGFADGTMAAFRADGSGVDWVVNLAGGTNPVDVDATPVLDGDRLYTASFNGDLYALSRKDGRTLWKQPISTAVPVAVQGSRVFATSVDNDIYALDRETGSVLWKRKSPEPGKALTAPVVYKTVLMVGVDEEEMMFLDAKDGTFMFPRFARKGILSAPLLDENFLYYLSNGGRVYCLKLIDKHLPPS